METQLATDSTQNGLDLLFKEQLVTDQNIMLKIGGVFSTATGLRSYTGSLHKFLQKDAPRARTVKNHYRSNKGLLKLGAGVAYESDTVNNKMSAELSARKQFQVKPDCWLKFLAKGNYDPKSQSVAGLGRAQLTKSLWNFTETQDVRLRVGYEAVVDQKGNVAGKPFGQIRENNWSFNTNFAGWWGIRYDL